MAQSSAPPPHRAIQRSLAIAQCRRPPAGGPTNYASARAYYEHYNYTITKNGRGTRERERSSGSSSDQQAPRLSLAHTSHDGFSRSRGMAGGTRKVPTAGDEQTVSSPRSVRRFIVPSEVTGLFLARFFQIPCAWKRQLPYPEFSGSALNMLCTPYTREIRDFMNPRAPRYARDTTNAEALGFMKSRIPLAM